VPPEEGVPAAEKLRLCRAIFVTNPRRREAGRV
jgi:hypothetical protein